MMMSRSIVRRIASLPIPFPSSLGPSLLRFSSHTTHPSDVTDPPSPSHDDLPADVTTQELKQRIDKYVQGDGEAIPSIFEAILARKLSGKHEDTDDEMMEELRSQTPHNIEDELFESDTSDEDYSESDEDNFESDDFNSESDEELTE